MPIIFSTIQKRKVKNIQSIKVYHINVNLSPTTIIHLFGPGIVAHTCNPSYMRSGLCTRPACASSKRKVNETLAQKKQPGTVVYNYNPSYLEGRGRRISV
jgi:hypothetical protein